MDAKMENLKPCRCGAQHPIVAKIKPGLFVVACSSCPCRALGRDEEEARENWNAEVRS